MRGGERGAQGRKGGVVARDVVIQHQPYFSDVPFSKFKPQLI